MSYFSSEVSGPRPNVDDHIFWDYCKQRELRFQRCASCGRFRHPPGPVCSACRSFESEWVLAPDHGVVFSFTIVHHPAHPAVAGKIPYNVVIVDFPDIGHTRLISNLIDANPEEVHIGMPVALVWEDSSTGIPLPRFKRKV